MVAAHRDRFCEQELSLRLSLGDGSVGADDAVPGEIVRRAEHPADEPRGRGLDVGEGADVTLGDPADTLADARVSVALFRSGTIADAARQASSMFESAAPAWA